MLVSSYKQQTPFLFIQLASKKTTPSIFFVVVVYFFIYN
jgi:hypothetical protein